MFLLSKVGFKEGGGHSAVLLWMKMKGCKIFPKSLSQYKDITSFQYKDRGRAFLWGGAKALQCTCKTVLQHVSEKMLWGIDTSLRRCVRKVILQRICEKMLWSTGTRLLQCVQKVMLQRICEKVCQRIASRGSFTVEAAFVLPLFLFAAVVVLGLFPVLLLQTQVNGGLQYAARMMAVSFQDEDDDGSLLTVAEGQILFRSYMKKHGYEDSVLKYGLNSISLVRSDFSGDEVLLCATYDAQLPISFWKVDSLPIEQCVRVKKWTGADTSSDAEDEDTVYITPTGSAYHSTTECSYLKLSIQGVTLSAAKQMRNKSGGIYYPCSCYSGGSFVYVTDYGTQYHSDLGCSGLKRTIYSVPKTEVGNRHACSKCY